MSSDSKEERMAATAATSEAALKAAAYGLVARPKPVFRKAIPAAIIRFEEPPPSTLAQAESLVAVLPVRKEGSAAATAAATAATASESEPSKKPDGRQEGPAPPEVAAILAGLKADKRVLATRTEAMSRINPVEISPEAFIPSTRRSFKQFIIQTYKPYTLPRLPSTIDPKACEKSAAASKTEQKAFLYQKFVRDYIQRASPYRGVLVYHGLGSGKTCTSIASMEALYQTSKQPIFVMTPASLNPNFRDEISKCGPFLFRLNNFWEFLPIRSKGAVAAGNEDEKRATFQYANEILKVSPFLLRNHGGVWVPDVTRQSKPNFDSLPPEQQAQVRKQVMEQIESRIQFINYNGLTESRVRAWACAPSNPFDNTTIVIDEVHNLIRTINNSGLEENYRQKEARDLAQYIPAGCATGRRYRISYLVYRLMCNAVGCKIVALSATPVINFPQEVGILANLLAGDMRMATVKMSGIEYRDEVNAFLNKHPEVEFAEVIPDPVKKSDSLIRVTPVPSGYRKVVDEATGEYRGLVWDQRLVEGDGERERNTVGWWSRIQTAMAGSKIQKRGTEVAYPATTAPEFRSVTRLPDTADTFEDIFIDTANFKVKDEARFILQSRLSGLVSFYKGGRADYMPRVESDEVVEVFMSDYQLRLYTVQRKAEIEDELRKRTKGKKGAAAPVEAAATAAGRLISYQTVKETQNATFKIFSRAACNFVFPSGMTRPIPANFRDALKDVGAKPAREAEAEEAGSAAGAGAGAAAVAAVEDAEEETDEGILTEAAAEGSDDDEPAVEESSSAAATVAATAATAAVATAATAVGTRKVVKKSPYEEAIDRAVGELRRNKEYFSPESLATLSPKFQKIIDTLETSPGPALIYSNFKTLEGVGVFGMALEAQKDYVRFDLEPDGRGGWAVKPETSTAGAGKKRYMMYTGDEDRAKRRALLAIFNGQWHKLPAALADDVKRFTGQANNLHGEIARVFMITQSGAEGISLANVRQVHLMESYWNYVRLDQVKGRAIRICSHSELPIEERTVQIFTYISKFRPETVKPPASYTGTRVDETLKNFDGGTTTDEYMYELMQRKKQLADSMIHMMKEAAVDCDLNREENKMDKGTLTCFTFRKFQTNAPLFHPLLEEDLKLTGTMRSAAAAGVTGTAAAGTAAAGTATGRAAELPTAAAELPTAAAELPTAAAELPTAAAELPAVAPAKAPVKAAPAKAPVKAAPAKKTTTAASKAVAAVAAKEAAPLTAEEAAAKAAKAAEVDAKMKATIARLTAPKVVVKKTNNTLSNKPPATAGTKKANKNNKGNKGNKGNKNKGPGNA